jgi:hypothetical protein
MQYAGHWWLRPILLGTQEDHGSKPVQVNSSQDPISKTPIPRKGLAKGLKW